MGTFLLLMCLAIHLRKNDMEYADLTLTKAQELLHNGDCSAVELTQSCIQRIEETEDNLNAFITVTAEQALSDAQKSDERRAAGEELSALAGIPLAHKDLFLTKGVETTAASQMLAGYIPPYSATVVERCADAGAVMIGKANCDEYAHGSSGEHSSYGPTRNPWDPDRVPGGSSSGSATAVAAGSALIATGTDTGGSIRVPASFCNVVGIKPTYGRVSRYGVVAMASSLDCPGVLGRTVRDVALGLGFLAGHDVRDATSARKEVPSYYDALDKGMAGLRIGVPQEYLTDDISSAVKEPVLAAIAELERMGAAVQEVSLPHTSYAIATYFIIVPAEISSNLARYDGIRYGLHDEENPTVTGSRSLGFGDEAKRRIILGTYGLSAGYADAYYKKATQVRAAIRKDFTDVFASVDLLAAPVAPDVPFLLGDKTEDPLRMYMEDVLTAPANLAGIPALSLPCGFANDTLPVGLQLLAPHFQEERLLQVAAAYQEATDWHTRRPSPVTNK